MDGVEVVKKDIRVLKNWIDQAYFDKPDRKITVIHTKKTMFDGFDQTWFLFLVCLLLWRFNKLNDFFVSSKLSSIQSTLSPYISNINISPIIKE